MYNSKFKPLYTAFLYSIKLYEYRIGIKLDKDPLAGEQNNYLNEIVNAQIVFDLDTWARNPIINFKVKNYLFGVINIVKNQKE